MQNISITSYTDWKDMEGQIESIQQSLAELGIMMVENPDVEGSDMFSWIIVKPGFTKAELETAVEDIIIPENMETLSEGDMERRDDIVNQVMDEVSELMSDRLDEILRYEVYGDEELNKILDKHEVSFSDYDANTFVGYEKDEEFINDLKQYVVGVKYGGEIR